MRTFFVFDIRDEYLALYYNYEISLYNLLKQVYNIKKDNIIYGKQLFCQLIKPLPKEELDRRLFITLHQDIPYSKRCNIHIYNNFYLSEITTMEEDQNYFFKGLYKENHNFFVCDFANNDYFFLKDIYKNNKLIGTY